MKNTTTEKPMQPNTMKSIRIIPNGSYVLIPETQPRVIAGKVYSAEPATNQPDWEAEGKVFVNGLLLSRKDYALAPAYRKGTLEARLDELLPNYEAFDVIAHELWSDGDGGWSVNDSWKMARGVSREDAISALRGRWEVFKTNYHAKARVCDLADANWSGDEFPALLEVDCIAFAEIRNASEQ